MGASIDNEAFNIQCLPQVQELNLNLAHKHYCCSSLEKHKGISMIQHAAS